MSGSIEEPTGKQVKAYNTEKKDNYLFWEQDLLDMF